MLAKFQANYFKYQEDVQSGNLTQVMQKEIESNLEVEQGALDNYRRSAQESLEKRRAELVKPLLDKINNAIQLVGKEGNYNFIFDSGQSLLFVTESNDLFKEVFAKLNP
jgi:outer membrane protein